MINKNVMACIVFCGMVSPISAGISGLYEFIHKGDAKKVKEFLGKGNARIDEADVALAASKGDVEIIAMLLAAGAPLDESVMQNAIRGACSRPSAQKEYEQVVEMLLKAFAPFDKSTFSAALECGNMNIIKMLAQAMPDFSFSKSPTRRLHGQ